MKTGEFDPAKKNLLERIKKIDRRLDYIRIPEDKTVIEGKPLPEWLKEHAGQEAKKFYLLVVF